MPSKGKVRSRFSKQELFRDVSDKAKDMNENPKATQKSGIW
jgi:hypothetical protein